jgi:nitrogen regulatory protein PII
MPTMIRCIMGAENLPAFVEGMVNLAVGMTVSETREYGPTLEHIVSYRGVPYDVGSLSVTVDIVSDESWVEDIIRKVHDAYTRDEFIVRHVSIYPVEATYHIRNGFMDV